MKALLLLAALAAGTAHAQAAHPELVSFADLVRLASRGPAAPASAAVEPLRVTFLQPAAAAPRFSVSAARSRGWMLLFSGLALAGWVAHRRLTSPL
jgi:hypothetical protein